jgi:hypothetical protein
VSRATNYARFVVVLLVATLLWVPTAVRAARPVHAPAGTSIRLNRGFDLPVDKQVLPPADLPSTIPAAAARHQASALALRSTSAGADALPDSPVQFAPDPLRGPPSTTLD